MGLRITTWNVNGIRNPFGYQPWRENRTFQAMFDILEADIVIMQETKIQRKDLRDDMVLVPGWDVYFSLPKHKKGYSGVAIYTRNSKCCPIKAEEGITGVLCPPNSSTKYRELPPDQQIGGYPTEDQLPDALDEIVLDSEGRCVILEFPAFVLIGVYSPATRDETRTEFRLGFLDALDARVRNLVAMGKEVVLAGDLNIIRSELDTAGLQEQLRKEGMTIEDFISSPSRRFLNHLVFNGKVVGDRDDGRDKPVLWDLCREFHPTRQGMYTCWETKKNARPGNFGSRIDYVLCTSGIKDWFIDSNIQEGLMGSDHCPVYAILADSATVDGKKLYIADVMNPPGMFKDGKRLRDWDTKDLLPTSAKLIPEFDRRRSIKDMFFKKPALPKNESSSLSLAPSESIETERRGPAKAPTVTASTDTVLISRSPTSPDVSGSVNASSTTTIPSPEASSSQKRPAEAPNTSKRPQKRTKATLTKENSARASCSFSQSSLKGFFKPKSDPSSPAKQSERQDKDEAASPSKVPAAAPKTASPVRVMSQEQTENKGSPRASSQKGSGADKTGGDVVFDPIQNKESWSKLLGKRVVPKCEHEEPCISLVTKKPGVNCGRSFFICPRPLGPSGEKEKGTQWRCGTFIWSSDWNGTQGV